MTRLRNFPWRVGYSSDEDDLLTAFYEPAMSIATQYDRGVGYFSSQALALIAGGIRELYLRNGKMRLIASPIMSESDREALWRGHVNREQLIQQRLLDKIDVERLSVEAEYRLQLLSGMIADNLLQVRIAVKEDPDGFTGLYHEKVGVFSDGQDYVTFIGSLNETWNGWVGNAESFALHTSWDFGSEHAEYERARFMRTWKGERKRVLVRDIPDAVRSGLFERFPPRSPESPPPRRRVTRHRVRLPDWLEHGEKLYPYQIDAVNSWFDQGGRGIFAMATGTGKTVTALVAAVKIVEALNHRRKPLLITVVAPTRDLVAQWIQNARSFGFRPLACHSGNSQWRTSLSTIVRALNFAEPSIEMVIVTADTFVSSDFVEISRQYSKTSLLIADEVHSLGSRRRLAALPEQTKYRLGLSATPRRHGDEDGTQGLLEYFGPICQRIDIKEAIALGALVPYSYEPIMVRLDHEEMFEYRDLSARIAAAMAHGGDSEPSAAAKSLLMKRSRLLSHAAQKLPTLRSVMTPRASSKHNLVYVAEGSHPLTDINQLDRVLSMLGDELGMKVNTYTSSTPPERRMQYQAMLREGSLQALIAMRCLDEGVDIPEVRRGVILASTRNPRQFVQRRGRLLRRDDASDKERAELIDMFVVPDVCPEKSSPNFRTERQLVGRELSRALELASASLNHGDVPPAALVDLMSQYELLEFVANYHDPPRWEEGGQNVYND